MSRTSVAEGAKPPNGPGDQLPPGHESWNNYTRSMPDASRRMPERSPGTYDAFDYGPRRSVAFPR